MIQRLVWVVLAVLSAYAVFIGGAWWGIYQPALRVLSLGIAAAVLAAWAHVAWRRPAWRPRSVLLPAIMACLASLAISTVFSRFPLVSLEYLAYAVLLAALYLLLVRLLGSEFFRGRFVVLSGGLFAGIAALFLALTVSHWATWLSVLGAPAIPPLRPEFESLTFGNPSTVLTVVAMLAIPVVASASWTTGRGLAAAMAVLVVVGVVALVSGSRSGWLALAIAGLVALAIGIATRDARDWFRVRTLAIARRTGGRAAIIGVAVAALGIVAIVGPSVIRRAAQGGESIRLTFVRIALELFGESPVVGTGPGSWVIQRPARTLPADVDEYIPHAHNLYAQTLAELGVIGVIAGVALVAALLWLVRDAMRDGDVRRRRWGFATLIGFVYFGVHQVLDFYANFPSVLFAAAIPIAYLDATSTRSPWPTVRVPLGRLAGRVAIPLVIAAVLLLGAQEIPALSANAAVDRANAGDWAAADAPARAAAAQDPRISSYLFTAGLTAAHAGDHAAAAAYFEAVVKHDDVPEAWLNLAAEQAELGATADARASIMRALRTGWQRTAVSVPAGDLALRVGDHDLAIAAFTAAIRSAPSLLADPWWLTEASRTQLRSEVVTAVMASAPPALGWEVALMSGDAEGARAIASSAGLDPAALDFVEAWAGNTAAYDRLIGRCRAEPFRLDLLLWCARIEGRRGNDRAANDFRYLASAQIGNAYRTGAELRINTRTPVGRSLEGNPAIFWGAYTYRRFTPWDVLVPSLLHLTLE